jgi:hypothetical protein
MDLPTRLLAASSKNTNLLRLLSETDHAIPNLTAQNRLITDLEAQTTASDARLKALNLKRLFELSDHEKYRDSVLRRFAYKATGQRAKFESAAAKEETEYFAALQAQHRETELNTHLKAQLDVARAAASALEPVAALHAQTQRELNALYDELFAGATPSFPREDELEQAAGRAGRAHREARERAEGEGHAVKLLREAQGRMKAAMGAMEQAVQASRGDMFGGAGADIMERHALTRAENEVLATRMLVLQAQGMAVGVLGELPAVEIAQGNLMRDVFFDNLMTDYAFHEKIKVGRESVRRCAVVLDKMEVESAARWEELEEERKRREAEMQAARAALQRERQSAFEAVAKT